MGTWGHRTFENDDASDWVDELEESQDFSAIDAALDSIVRANGGYLESPDCCRALAAAEVIVALLGRPAPELPPEIAAWASRQPKPPYALVQKAVSSIEAILHNSELAELWAEGDDLSMWESTVNELRARLRHDPSGSMGHKPPK